MSPHFSEVVHSVSVIRLDRSPILQSFGLFDPRCENGMILPACVTLERLWHVACTSQLGSDCTSLEACRLLQPDSFTDFERLQDVMCSLLSSVQFQFHVFGLLSSNAPFVATSDAFVQIAAENIIFALLEKAHRPDEDLSHFLSCATELALHISTIDEWQSWLKRLVTTHPHLFVFIEQWRTSPDDRIIEMHTLLSQSTMTFMTSPGQTPTPPPPMASMSPRTTSSTSLPPITPRARSLPITSKTCSLSLVIMTAALLCAPLHDMHPHTAVAIKFLVCMASLVFND